MERIEPIIERLGLMKQCCPLLTATFEIQFRT